MSVNELGGKCILTVKNNQPALYADLATYSHKAFALLLPRRFPHQ